MSTRHYRLPADHSHAGRAACGSNALTPRTSLPVLVSCEECKATPAYQEALAAFLEAEERRPHVKLCPEGV